MLLMALETLMNIAFTILLRRFKTIKKIQLYKTKIFENNLLTFFNTVFNT